MRSTHCERDRVHFQDAKQEANTSQMPGRGRIDYLDVAKGMGILLAVFVHSGLRDGIVCRIAASFFMPMFFIVGGYFLAGRKSLEAFIAARSRQLLIPFVVTQVLITVWYMIAQYLHNQLTPSLVLWLLTNALTGGVKIGSFCVNAAQVMWFLPAMWCASILTRWAMDRKRPLFIVLLMTVAGYALSHYCVLPLRINQGPESTLYMYIGVLLRMRADRTEPVSANFARNTVRRRIRQVALWFLLWLGGFLFAESELILPIVPRILLRTLTAISGSLIFFELSKALCCSAVVKRF